LFSLSSKVEQMHDRTSGIIFSKLYDNIFANIFNNYIFRQNLLLIEFFNKFSLGD
jgi:hypothetical protein